MPDSPGSNVCPSDMCAFDGGVMSVTAHANFVSITILDNEDGEVGVTLPPEATWWLTQQLAQAMWRMAVASDSAGESL